METKCISQSNERLSQTVDGSRQNNAVTALNSTHTDASGFKIVQHNTRTFTHICRFTYLPLFISCVFSIATPNRFG